MRDELLFKIMEEGIETAKSRSKEYGQSYLDFGRVMAAIFPDGLEIKTEKEWQRLGILSQIVGKLLRYTPRFKEGGHQDSARDMAVYGFILERIDWDEIEISDKTKLLKDISTDDILSK